MRANTLTLAVALLSVLFAFALPARAFETKPFASSGPARAALAAEQSRAALITIVLIRFSPNALMP